jgi:hypothetical protein
MRNLLQSNFKNLLLVIFYTLSFPTILAQSYCETPATTKHIKENNDLKQMAVNANHYCIRVYFHVITTSNGIGDQTPATVAQAYQILNDDFAAHNISFYWDGEIDDVQASPNGPVLEFPDPIGGPQSIFSVNNHDDGIDIYLFSDYCGHNFGQANGVGTSGELLLAGRLFGQSLTTSHAISHEMGHVLFLWHTHHGTYLEGGDPDQCSELVNGTNATICGDYVEDTPADPLIDFDVNPTTCIWNQYGNVFDANNEPYNPDTANLMSYTRLNCMEYFSPKQGQRMRNAIETLPFLQDALMNCELCSADNEPDLMIRDSEDDNGTEPNTISPNTWTSNDIWVRHNNDNGTEHQNPQYETDNQTNEVIPNYVYVRVTNKNCYPSSGDGQLEVYWTKANLSSTWPDSWDGTEFIDPPFNTIPKGGIVGTVNLPEIPAGEEVIIPVLWDDVPNPLDYEGVGEPWHFCLLARIVSDEDPMTYTENENVGYNVRYNNNIASKNVTVIKVNDDKQASGTVAVYNPYSNSETFDIEFKADDRESGKKIFEEAEVYIKLSADLYAAWVAGGSQSSNIVIPPSSISTIHTLKVTGDNAKLKNINLPAKATKVFALKFNFLTKASTSKTEFTYHVSQKKTSNQEVLGGNTYFIKKPPRSLFQANADDVSANRNETVTLTVDEINENAVYNWYDADGELIYTGTSLTVVADIAKTYKVEIVADEDGFKDYKDVEIALNPHQLTSIAPNPSSNNITVSYNLNAPNSAYISIVGYVGNDTGVQRNYILDTNTSQTNIDISSYATGYFTVALVCDGQVVESLNLVKQ